jgi:hypothetical protein
VHHDEEATVPTYEHLDDNGQVVERSVTFPGTHLDDQLAAAAADPATSWWLIDADGTRRKTTPAPADTPPVPDHDEDQAAVDEPPAPVPAKAGPPAWPAETPPEHLTGDLAPTDHTSPAEPGADAEEA